MSYITTFYLYASDFKTGKPFTKQEIKKFAKELDDTYNLYSCGDTVFSINWYDHDKDMIEFSKKYPTVLFELHGEGEDADDLWKSYYHNGKSQTIKAKIVFDEPDLKSLK